MKKMNLMRYLKMFLPILVIGICFSSCTKEDIDTTPTPTQVEDIDPELVRDIQDKNDVGVFAFNSSSCDCYGPFAGIDWENEIDEEVEAEIEAAIASMTEEELEELFTPVCTDDGGFYPNACFAECEGVTDYEECTDISGEWDDEDEWGCDGAYLDYLGCYELQFPVTITFADGTTTAVNDYEEYFAAVLTIGSEPQIVFPITLLDFVTGEEIVVSSDEELDALAADCLTGGGSGPDGPPIEWDEECIEDATFSLIIDGDIIAEFGMDETGEGIEAAIQEYVDNNPGSNFEITFGYPMTLTFDSGDSVTVNKDEEFMDAMLEFCP